MQSRSGFRTINSKLPNILVIKCNGVSDFRVELAAKHLQANGYDVEVISEVPFYKAAQYDLIICSRPGPEMLNFLQVAEAAGKRIILDMDDDFYAIPKHNPSYNYIGPGNQTYHRDLGRMMARNEVVFASPELANRYNISGTIIPNCFDESNPLWMMPKSPSEHIRLGFTGTNTHREDFKLCQDAVRQIIREDPRVKIIIGNDAGIFDRFNDIPEAQRGFIPPLLYVDYPMTFSIIDILLVPLHDTHFNRAKSDIKLLEAGVTHTPYIASPLPVYEEWNRQANGGALCRDEDWYQTIKDMICLGTDMVKGPELDEAVHKRRSEHLAGSWLELIKTGAVS